VRVDQFLKVSEPIAMTWSGEIENRRSPYYPRLFRRRSTGFRRRIQQATADEAGSGSARSRSSTSLGGFDANGHKRFHWSELRATACNSASCCARCSVATGGRAALEHQGSAAAKLLLGQIR